MNQNTEYEKFAQEIYQELLNSESINKIDVLHNIKLTGKSGQQHQIDVYWEYEIHGVVHKVVIECKNYNREISIGRVRDFFGVLFDLTDVSGIMVTKVGYQKGAKKYADHYNINLRELRTPHEKDDCRVGELETDIQISIRRRTFLFDYDWAKANDIDWSLYRSRMASISQQSDAWDDEYLPLETKGTAIFNEKGQVIITLDELEDKIPQKAEHVYSFENAYVDSRHWGRVKIRAIKYVNKETREHKVFVIDARNAVKAILKDVFNDKIMFFLRDVK